MNGAQKILLTVLIALLTYLAPAELRAAKFPYTIVDTAQIRCYSDNIEIQYPKTGQAFFGQDAQYNGVQPAYKDNRDGTITDLNTGLMWQSDPGSKKTLALAVANASNCKNAG